MKRFALLVALLVAGTFVGSQVSNAAAGELKPFRLRCEYVESPLGVDTEKPRFSWALDASYNGAEQMAYRILVAGSLEDLSPGSADAWDSGRVESSEQINVVYDGKPLQSGEKYVWKVRAWNEDGQAGPWSDAASFQMGLLDGAEWQGAWIGAPSTDISAPMLRKEFSMDREIESAHVYICGLGYYEMFLNGRKVGDHVMDPGTTEYDKRALYETYDVTPHLRSGENAVGVLLGNGYWRHTAKAWYEHQKEPYGDRPVLLMQLNVTFADGSTASIVSDNSWKTSKSCIISNSVWNGEIYDARLEQPGWKKPGFDDSGWKQAKELDPDVGVLDSQLMPPIKVTKTLRPVDMVEAKDGVYVFDFGQNMTGVPRLSVDGEKGTKITLETAEVNRREMARMKEEEVQGNPDVIDDRPNRSAKARNIYILKGGEGKEVYEPRFTYQGFRYVQVEGFPGDPDMLNVEARVMHTDVEHTGRFHSSNTLLNKIHENIIWGQYSNLHSIPMDCPQRDERQGWMGDAHLTAEEAMLNFDMAAFYTKWLRDVRDSQHEDGSLPDTVPYHDYGGKVGTPAWQVAYPLVAWNMYKYYGDTRILRKHYDALDHWMDYMKSIADGHIVARGRGDWVPPKRTRPKNKQQPHLTSTAYYYRSAQIMAEMARLLQLDTKAQHYAKLAGRIKEAFNERFFHPDAGRYLKGGQTSNAFPLYFDMVPDGHEKKVLENLVRSIMEKRNGHLWTGILGTKALVEVLPPRGRAEVLYTVATQQTFPSWGFMLAKGATTLWERWGGYRFFDAGMNSLNHIMFGSIDEFFYRDIAGVSPAEPGFKSITYRPHLLGDLTSARASVETMRGPAASSWRLRGESLILEVQNPVNADGTVYVPKMGMEGVTVKVNGRLVWKDGTFVGGAAGVKDGTNEGGRVAFDVAGGTYLFHITGSR